jgi:glycosyltransferase involved in cell wall biosynthesis
VSQEAFMITSMDKPHDGPGAGGDRLVLDVTSTCRWTGPPVGIVRVEQELIRYAIATRPDVVFAFHHPSLGDRTLNPAWVGTVTGSRGVIDPLHFLRARLRGVRRWRPSRYPAVTALERLRLRAESATVRRAADLMQQALLFGQRRPPYFDAHGDRQDVVPIDLALGRPLSMGPCDILLTAGYPWLTHEIDALIARKRRHGFRWTTLCYDIIPLLYPAFFHAHDVEDFRRYWISAFAHADCIIFNARRIEADARAFCDQAGIRIGRTAVVPLGYEPPAPRVQGDRSLPPFLDRRRFALFVSTIEPRKGHDLLLRVWRRLLAEGVPQRHRFNLVLVGRRGWKVDAVLREIDELAGEQGMLRLFSDLSDPDLAALHENAAFCLYPSIYEGFGLPVIEAFSHGRAVIASRGGALLETVGGLSPCLDPQDEGAWYACLREWIENPAAYQPIEEKIRSSFSHPTWRDAAANLLAAAATASETTSCRDQNRQRSRVDPS